LFSATFTDDIEAVIQKFITSLKAFRVAKEALKLKGIQMLRVGVNPENKASFIDEVYNNLGNYQTMIFMNTKKDAELLEGRLKIKGILA